MPPQLLVVEDDDVLGEGLERSLSAEGYDVRWARTAGEALGLDGLDRVELVLLDLGLPDLDGVEVCRQLRARLPLTTIVILTARTEEVDIVVGLDAGADDYLTKPFRRAELLARVRAHVRRSGSAGAGPAIAVGPLALDLEAHRVEVQGSEVELRPKEFDLLALLAAEAGKVVTRERIMTEVWDEHWFGPTKTLDMHMSSLRRKLGAAGDLITTVRGVGYRLERP
jgi:DNA-binding response OmpR family regulator